MTKLKSTIELESIDTEWALYDEDEIEVAHWAKHGHNRLYINGINSKDCYLDLSTGDLETPRYYDGEYEVDGNELVITLWYSRGDEPSRHISLHVDAVVTNDSEESETEDVDEDETTKCAECGHQTSDAVWAEDEWMCRSCASGHHVVHDPAEQGDQNEGKELVTDGGHTSDLDGYTIDRYPNEVDNGHGVLIGLNEWGAWYYVETHDRVDNYKREEAQDKYEEKRTPMNETFDASQNLEGEELAEFIMDLDVIAKDGFKIIYESSGVEACVNSLIRAGLSPGQAWSYYGVKILRNSRNGWAKECGYNDHSAVSEPLRKAEEKLDVQ